jgi:hypothetical protein
MSAAWARHAGAAGVPGGLLQQMPGCRPGFCCAGYPDDASGVTTGGWVGAGWGIGGAGWRSSRRTGTPRSRRGRRCSRRCWTGGGASSRHECRLSWPDSRSPLPGHQPLGNAKNIQILGATGTDSSYSLARPYRRLRESATTRADGCLCGDHVTPSAESVRAGRRWQEEGFPYRSFIPGGLSAQVLIAPG